MSFFDYNRDIPNAPNNPSNDQPLMQINTNSIDDLINIDHFSFENDDGGLHKQVRMPIISGGAKPSGIANEILLYPKTISSQSELFLARDTNAFETQMTVAKFGNGTTDIPFTATQAVIGAIPGSVTYYVSYLPGGYILMFFTFTSTLPFPSGANTINFTLPSNGFPNNYLFANVSGRGVTAGSNNTFLINQATSSQTNIGVNVNIASASTINGFNVTVLGN